VPASTWQAALAAAKRLALRFPGVVGVDYGYRHRAGVSTSQPAVRFHVSRKLPPAALRPHELLPTTLAGVACDVIQANYLLHASPQTHSDLLRPGLSISNAARRGKGTLGAMVRDGGNDRICLLSSWHVLCAASAAQPGEPISQPSRGAGQPVAALERWLDLTQGYDAAIAVLSLGIEHDGSVLGLHIVGTEEPGLGLALVKCGAASGNTHAIVDGIGGTFELDYGTFGERKRWMDGIRLIPGPDNPGGAISAVGDSGAVWINPATECAVALHLAGSSGSTAQCAIAHPISNIFKLLDLRL
jgi:hypothetical protein